MNQYLKKRCAVLLAAIMMATSIANPVFAVGTSALVLENETQTENAEEQGSVCSEKYETVITKKERAALSEHHNLKSNDESNYKVYGNLKYEEDSYHKTISIVGFIGSPSELVIPEEIEGVPVTTIKRDAFKNCTSLTSIQFPKNKFNYWEEIEYSMLEGCINLKQIKVDPENPVMKSIDGILYSKDGKTLRYCPNAKSGKITIPEGVEELTSAAFFKCTKVTEITLPSTAKKIAWFRQGIYASAYGGTFSGCTSLISIKVNSKNPLYKSVDGCVYSKDGKSLYVVPNGKKGVFTVPKGVTTIGEKESKYDNDFRPFDGCNQITKIIIPETVETLAGTNNYKYYDGEGTYTRAFLGCSKLEAISVDGKNTVYSSKKGVLYNKEKSILICCPSYMKNISIPKTVTKISYNAFYNCTRLKKVELPSRVNQFEKSSVVESGFNLYFNCEKIPDFSKSTFDSKKMNWTLGSVEKFPTGYYYESLNVWKKAIEKDRNFAGISWKKASGKPDIISHIELDKNELNLILKETCSLKLSKSINLSNKKVEWSSKDKSVATVNSKGVVTAKKIGTTVITAKCDDQIATCTVWVGLANPEIKKVISSEKGKIKLTWTKVEGADGYTIIRGDGNFSNFKAIKNLKNTATSYTDKTVKSGKKYIYIVDAYKHVDNATHSFSSHSSEPVKAK